MWKCQCACHCQLLKHTVAWAPPAFQLQGILSQKVKTKVAKLLKLFESIFLAQKVKSISLNSMNIKLFENSLKWYFQKSTCQGKFGGGGAIRPETRTVFGTSCVIRKYPVWSLHKPVYHLIGHWLGRDFVGNISVILLTCDLAESQRHSFESHCQSPFTL